MVEADVRGPDAFVDRNGAGAIQHQDELMVVSMSMGAAMAPLRHPVDAKKALDLERNVTIVLGEYQPAARIDDFRESNALTMFHACYRP
jgi:hypothetical protein